MTVYEYSSGELRPITEELDENGGNAPFIKAREVVGLNRDIRTAGVFTTIMVKDKVPVFLDEHLSRLFSNAAAIGKSLDHSSMRYVEQTIIDLAFGGDKGLYGIRPAIWHLEETGYFDPNIDFTIDPFKLHFEDQWYENGVKVDFQVGNRQMANVKSVVFKESLDAKEWADNRGCFEALLENEKGMVYEGATSNVFWARDGRVETPGNNMLPGVTRYKVLGICEQEGIPVDVGDYRNTRVITADEVFLTGTTKGVVPVVRIGDARIKKGVIGEYTRKIMSRYRELVRDYIAERKI